MLSVMQQILSIVYDDALPYVACMPVGGQSLTHNVQNREKIRQPAEEIARSTETKWRTF